MDTHLPVVIGYGYLFSLLFQVVAQLAAKDIVIANTERLEKCVLHIPIILQDILQA